MGNLQISNYHSRSPYIRKPIFARQNSLYHDGASRSLSPYLLKTPRSNIYQNQHMKVSNISQKGSLKNHIYLNSKMIKSVIKDTSNRQNSHSHSHTARLKKSLINNQEFSRFRHTRTHTDYNNNNLNLSGQKYCEKPFQKLSPSNNQINQSLFSRIPKKFIKHQKYVEAHPSFDDHIGEDQINQMVISAINKQNNHAKMIKPIKFGRTGCNSYDQDGHFVQNNHRVQKNQCCIHCSRKQQYTNNISQTYDNAPTERKKPVRLFQPIKTIQQSFQHNPYQYQKSKTSNNQTLHLQNRQKCQQIIKRVRNFNQFLNQVKSKLKKQVQTASSHNSTFDNVSNNVSAQTSIDQFSANSISNKNNNNGKKSNKSSIKLALRLQNQKIQLEKYRKLVQRQLSKQHSIQSIAIQQKNKEKVITINFQQNQTYPQRQKQKNSNPKFPTQQPSYQQSEPRQIAPKKSKTKQKTINIQQQNSKISKNIKQMKQAGINKRLNKIQNLFNKMQGINRFQAQNNKQINQVLVQNSEQDFQDGNQM